MAIINRTNIKAFPALILACFLSLNLCSHLPAQVSDDGVQNFMAQTSGAISARAPKKPKPPTVNLSVSLPTTINEGDSATFTVSASTVNPSQSITVNYSMSGTAVFGADYILSGTPGQVTIPAGVSSASITLTALTDNVFPEPNETAIITLGPGAGYKLAKSKKKAPKPTVTIVDVVPAPLGITAVSDAAPLPLSPLTLATTGLAQAGAVSVYFFNDVGFSANAKAIHVETNGTVVIGVPLYMDPASKSIASGTVSMVLRQGNNSSPPASINIQNLPTLDTYGTQLGEISHDFLILEAALLGHKLNLLQSAQLLQSNVDTSAAQANTKALLTTAIKSTHDVDGVMSQNSTAVSWGNLLDGTPIQFDKDQLDIMDRVIALYLTQQFSGLVSSSSAAGAGTSSVAGHSNISPSDASSVMSEILHIIVNGDGPALVQYVQGNGNGTEAGLATVDALGGSVLNASERTIGSAPGGLVGQLTGFGHIYNNVNAMFGDISPIATCLSDPSCIDGHVLQMQLDSDARKVVTSIAAEVAKIPEVAGLEDNTAALISGTLSFLAKLADLGSSGGLKSDDQTISTVAQTSVLDRLGVVSGTFNPPSGHDPSSISLCCFGAKSLGVTGASDSNGKYSVLTPVNVGGTSYDHTTINADDFVSGDSLGSTTVDLSGLDTSHPVQVPPFTGGIVTKIYDGTYQGHYNGTLTCSAEGVTSNQPINSPQYNPLFTILNGSVVGTGISGSVNLTGQVTMIIPTPYGPMTMTGSVSIVGTAGGGWSFSVPYCTAGGTWSATKN